MKEPFLNSVGSVERQSALKMVYDLDFTGSLLVLVESHTSYTPSALVSDPLEFVKGKGVRSHLHDIRLSRLLCKQVCAQRSRSVLKFLIRMPRGGGMVARNEACH